MRIKANKIIENASWIVLCRIMQSLVNLVIGMISARYLGPSNYGLISYAGSLVAFLVPIVQLGFRNTFVQELIANPKQEGEIVGTILISTIFTSLLGIAGIVAFVTIMNKNDFETIIVCLLYSISLVFQMLELIEYWFQAKLLSKYTAITSLIAYGIVSLYKIYLLVMEKSIYWFAISQALDYMLVSVALIIIYYKLGGQRLRSSLALFKKLFSRSKYYILSGIMVMIYQHTDRIMISVMLGEKANGYYSAAITCAGVAAFVFSAIIDSARPVILESKKDNEGLFENNLVRLFSIIIYLGLIQSLFFTLMSRLCVRVLYGVEYYPAVSVLRIITWYSTFSYLGSIRNIWILAKNKQKVLWIINLVGAVFNIVGNYFLIPELGTDGAAIASVATYILVDFVLCFIIKSIRPCGELMLKALNPNNVIDILRKNKDNSY